MNYTKCTGKPLALEYNENYLYNVKLACYCPYCCLTTKREPTPYKIIKTDNGFIEIYDENYYDKKEKKYEQRDYRINFYPCNALHMVFYIF